MEQSEACRTIPPVTKTDYTPKGRYERLSDLDVYIVGNESSSRGIFDLYDVFGLQAQTLQGADRLASSLDALVLMPDFCKGAPADPAWFPPDTDEKKEAAAKFRAQMGNPADTVPMLLRTVVEAKQKWPSVQGWGVFGLCWGGKIAALASGPETPFRVSGQAHPGRLAAEDAEKMTIPHICLASHDEPADVVKEYAKVLSSDGKAGHVETYETVFHGWMGARANLEDEENEKEFDRGYKQTAEFFGKYL